MDNAAFRKRRDIQESVATAGRALEYLPPYSPDLNPIEKKWARLKTLHKKLQCSVVTLLSHYAI
jgi:transposase